ncbi:MAG: avidin/streptavidin family protein [Methylocystis sp.]|uniref:avidin/streptavidin family protein n=1 Tax=Methylocystis sp. TaxID=1911079 RepID=UPI0039598F83
MFLEKSLARAARGTGAAVDFTGKWQNELGSIATIAQTGDVIAGQYVSAVSEGGTSTTGVLSGFVDGDLISFVVHWDQFQAITAWVGQLDPKASTQTINTLWQMTSQVPPGDEWASINAGADVFVRIA